MTKTIGQTAPYPEFPNRCAHPQGLSLLHCVRQSGHHQFSPCAAGWRMGLWHAWFVDTWGCGTVKLTVARAATRSLTVTLTSNVAVAADDASRVVLAFLTGTLIAILMRDWLAVAHSLIVTLTCDAAVDEQRVILIVSLTCNPVVRSLIVTLTVADGC